MSDAPERIWYNGTTLHARELRWRPPETNAHPQIEYIRADIARALPAVQPAPRRATGPIDPEAGFATTGAEARWITDMDAGVYDVQPKVKPLVWEDVMIDRGDGHSEPSGDYEARCAWGLYYIEMGFGSDSYYWSVETNMLGVGGSFDDPDAAKAAAQADYEARILSALELAVQPDNPDNPGKEVMPDEDQKPNITKSDTAPAGLSAGGGDWPEDAAKIEAITEALQAEGE